MTLPFATQPHAKPAGVLPAKEDYYDGVIIDELGLPEAAPEFLAALAASLSHWRAAGKRGVWLKVPAARSALIAPAMEQGFGFHHAEPGYLMLTRWLPTEQPCTLPPNASHQARPVRR